MKLGSSLLMLAIAGSVVPDAAAGQKARPDPVAVPIITDATPQPDYILQTCGETESTGDPRSAMRAVDPAYMLTNYLNSHSSKQVVFNLADIKNVTMLEGTKHGKIFAEVDNESLTSYHYDSEPSYVGNDKAVFQAEFEGKVYKIVLELRVFLMVNEYEPTCPPPQLIKVKKPSTGSSGYGK